MPSLTQVPPDTAALIDAALGYAARGWPVFPCSPKNKAPLLANERDGDGKPIPKTGGVKQASVDPDQIREWWKRWPKAMIGVATGHARLFVLDFDPRVDDATGEEWTLDSLKADLEAQMGCEVPASLISLTQSGGVHVWLSWPDDAGDAIRNRGNLPDHVDVRGLGGYVIAPPSVMATGKAYRWLRERDVAQAPASLVEILRSKEKASAAPSTSAERPSQPVRPRSHGDDPVEAARRKWALAALDNAVGEAEQLPDGGRNNGVNAIAYSLGRIVGAGYLSETTVHAELERVARLWPNVDKTVSTIERGLADGKAMPRDMSDIGQGAAQAADRWKDYDRPGAVRGSSAGPTAARPAAAPAGSFPTVPSGRVDFDSLTAKEGVQARTMARHWLRGQLRSVNAGMGGEALEKLAYRLGTRVAADLINDDAYEASQRSTLLGLAGLIATNPDATKSYQRGLSRPLDLGPIVLTLTCAQFPLTDFGLAERFNARFGQDFRFTTAKGWLGWDGMRWAVLDQDEKSPPARVIAAAWDTVRALQDEARAIDATGERHEGGLDYCYIKAKQLRWHHEDVALFGRQSETAGKPEGIQKLVRKWLTVPIEQFDCDPLAVNVLNGTLRFRRQKQGDRRVASVTLEAHRREDFNTKLCPVAYDDLAECPLYDGFIEWAQPDANVRRYLRQVVGYAITGHTGEQKLWFHYGRGANGKSTAFDIWAWCAGDYAGTIGIETFLDQGIKKRGEQASPDLARLGGVRFLRSSEPERGAKLNEALIKAATGEEPMAVRALHRGFFDLRPLFKLHIAGNYKPEIPGTDEGIWRRMKLVPWNQYRDEADRDELLGHKLRLEASGVLRWMIAGVLDWLENGLVEPEAVTSATAQYREDSDPLARFLKMCVVEDPNARVQSSVLHEVFVAWCRAAGETEWKITGFGKAMRDKGFKKKTSNGIQWLGIKLVKDVRDFVDVDGRALRLDDDEQPEPPRPFAPEPEREAWRPGQFSDGFDEPPDF
jgi:putative DNA primase/helicase